VHVLTLDDLRSRPGSVARFQGADHGSMNSFYVVSSAPGKGAAKHRHPYEEIFVILGGDIEVTVDDESGRLGPGHVVVIPPRTWHAFINRGDTEASMVNIHDSATMIQEDWDVVVHGDARG
jgi:mannose-6-phosphate isomerase-like protein (cupin superfamily)